MIKKLKKLNIKKTKINIFCAEIVKKTIFLIIYMYQIALINKYYSK